MTTDFNHLSAAPPLTGLENFPLQIPGGATLRTTLNNIIAQAIAVALGQLVLPSGDTTGVTDAINMANAASQVAAGVRSYLSPGASLPGNYVTSSYRLGAGTFYLTGATPLLLDTLLAHPTFGVGVIGMPSGATIIDYNPTVPGTTFLTNRWLIGTVFQDIGFSGHDVTANFMDSIQSPGAAVQDYKFVRCNWGGTWQHIFNLLGANNNSEWCISQCGVSATMNGSWLNVGPSVGGGGDQFLNFWFDDCRFDAHGVSSWLTLNFGGSVRLTGCDNSGWNPTTPTYLFNLLGFSHSRGVCSLSVDKLRMEMGSSNCLFLHSQWPSGNVSFDTVTQDTNAATYPTTNATALIEIQNNPGASYNFINCSFVGQHAYTYGTSAYQFQSNISYKSCNILQWPNAATFCTFTGTGNSGGTPVVEFDINCRGNDSSEMFPTTLNWHLSTSGITTPKTVQFIGQNSDAPLNLAALTRKLPVNAVLRSVNWNLAGTVGGAYGFAMQSSEAIPTVLSTFSGANGAAAANPAATPTNFWMRSDAQRTIQLVETAGRTSTFKTYLATVTYDG